MQGRFIIGAIAFAAFGSSATYAGEPAEPAKRWACQRVEQPQPRQPQTQQQQQQRARSQGCPVPRTIPPVVDPTPFFLL